MKQFFIVLALIPLFGFNLNAQQVSTEVTALIQPLEITMAADTTVKSADVDTAIVRIGSKDVKVIDHNNRTEIIWGKDKNKRRKCGKFNGHWEGVEFGFNAFDKPDYSLYDGVEFMSLNQGKSMEFDLNFYELNIGLAKSYVGLVSGMGLSFNNYRFENPYTLARGPMMTGAVHLDYEDLSKTKLAVSYLKVPVLIEFQIPVNQNEGRLFINGGIIGGVKIGSHTKVKHGDVKDKDRSGFNMNSFKYEATARIGYKGVALFANYSLTPLFQSGKGPELTPFTVGISFVD